MLVNFLRRAFVGLIGFVLLFILGYLGGWWIFVPVCAIGVIGMGEYYSALYRKSLRPSVGWGYICGILVLASAQFGPETGRGERVLACVFISVMIALVVQLARRRDQSAVVDSAITAFGVVYVAVLLSYFLRLRGLNLPQALGQTDASEFAQRMGAVLIVLCSVWLGGDTFAYLVGHKWGKHKLCPTISPGKTVEGAIGNLVGTLCFSLILGHLWLGLTVHHSFAIGLIMGTLGQVGDLAKSALKRDLGIKDFGGIFGAHGGVLDRFDAVLFVMPLVYWYLKIVLNA
jgi:phosphatidate cytidylyltransferase